MSNNSTSRSKSSAFFINGCCRAKNHMTRSFREQLPYFYWTCSEDNYEPRLSLEYRIARSPSLTIALFYQVQALSFPMDSILLKRVKCSCSLSQLSSTCLGHIIKAFDLSFRPFSHSPPPPPNGRQYMLVQ